MKMLLIIKYRFLWAFTAVVLIFILTPIAFLFRNILWLMPFVDDLIYYSDKITEVENQFFSKK